MRVPISGLVGAQAIREACLIRFRPIMMTTFAALAGTLPIAFSTGCAVRQPLGLAVVGGLVQPHIHVRYAGHKSSIAIEDGHVLAGDFPPKQLNLKTVVA